MLRTTRRNRNKREKKQADTITISTSTSRTTAAAAAGWFTFTLHQRDPNLFRLCRAEYAFAIWKPLDLDRSHVGSKYTIYLQFLAPFQTASKCGNLTRSWDILHVRERTNKELIPRRMDPFGAVVTNCLPTISLQISLTPRDEWTLNKRTNKRTNEQTDKQTNEGMHG